MSIAVREVKTKKELKLFIRFYTELYKDNLQVAFPMHIDEYNTLSQDKNPAFIHCKAKYWLAYEGTKIVGRIAAIINPKEQQKINEKIGRFGWFDFVDRYDVSSALIEMAEKWMLQKGVSKIHGPLGFSDLDRQGALIKGFDRPGTMATQYNYPYYAVHLEKLGFRKSTDWIEYELHTNGAKAELLQQIAARISKVSKCKSVKAKSRKEIKKYAPELFDIINESYADLYGCTELSQAQKKFYTDAYLNFVNLDLISLVADENGKLVGIGVSMPSFTKALQRMKGKLFPFGFLRMLKALKKNDRIDLYLIAVRKHVQGTGVNAIIMNDIVQGALKMGIKHAETNINLEDNHRILDMWRFFPSIQHKRRRCYIKDIQ
jgi:GNAT superfamily N-acetyltransferase